MVRSKFRLQTVLDYREQNVELRQQQLAELEAQVLDQRRVLTGVQSEIRMLCEDIRSTQMRRRLDCESVMRQLACLEGLQAREQKETACLADLEGRTQAKRDELVQAMREKQTLERLKERHVAQMLKDVMRSEGQVLDEIGVIRFRHTTEPGEAA